MVFRLAPAMGVNSYKTYSFRQPKTATTRLSSCEAADCPNYSNGWRTSVPTLSAAANYIRNDSGRRFTEEIVIDHSVFTFEPGQQCFAVHHVQDRPQFYFVRDGDFRGNPTGRKRQHTQAQFWVEDFQEHQAKLAEQIERG